ncbi:MAG TPA: DUF222 domain-containing protein [Trebonia sp.]|nr:DUF222 domain-containing protein [Trebonia sp.]
MTQPPTSGRGPGEEPARDSGSSGGATPAPDGQPPASERPARESARGDSAAAPGGQPSAGGSANASAAPPSGNRPGQGPIRKPGAPGGRTAGAPGVDGSQPPDGQRDLRLAGFAEGGAGDTCPPGPGLAATIAELSGPEWRCKGATDEELIGLLGRWDAIGSWAEAGKLGVVRELLRRRGRPGLGGAGSVHGDLPDRWEEGAGHEVSAALAISLRSADNLTAVAWDLQARLPGIGAALADGTLTPLKARIISDELKVLDDERAAEAEQLILGQLDRQTPAQLGRLAAHAVVSVDPDGAAKRRQHAEREEARVRFWRDNGGACALAAFGLPTDAALAANAAINDRAAQYKAARLRPDARMDQLRVLAFLDLLNGITLETRTACDRAAQADGSTGAGDGDHGTRAGSASTSGDGGAGSTGDRAGGNSTSDRGHGGSDRDDGSGSDADGSTTGSQHGRPGAPGGEPAAPAAAPVLPALTARANLTLPLATLLGLAERPGAGHGLGPLDPALVRDLAATVAGSPHSQWCVTITDDQGVAVAHGCAKPARGSKNRPAARDGPPRWALTRRDDPGPPGGYGTWTLTLPGGRELVVQLEPVPVTGCDHRHESRGYQPSDTLRHLVQVRDGTCTFPPCSRHARESDFEHAVPYDKGGRTCACNGSARSRRCHRVKQSPGWTVTQPQPGWHHWTTPSGRTYTQGPMRYPA